MRKFFSKEFTRMLMTALAAIMFNSSPARAQEVKGSLAPLQVTRHEKTTEAPPQAKSTAGIEFHQASASEFSPASERPVVLTTAVSETNVGSKLSKFRRASFDFTTSAASFAPVRSAGITQEGSNTDAPNIQSGVASRSANGSQNGPPIPVLSARQKFRYGLRQAFFSPGAYIAPGVGAALRRTQELEVPAKTGKDEFADYLSNYARDFGTSSTTELFGSGIYPALFKQNPIYTPLKEISQEKASRRARLLYALGGAVVTQGDNGKLQPNYSRFAGNLTGAALANIWERDTPKKRNGFGVVTEVNRRRGVGATFSRFGFSLGFDALSNVLEEFFGFGR